MRAAEVDDMPNTVGVPERSGGVPEHYDRLIGEPLELLYDV